MGKALGCQVANPAADNQPRQAQSHPGYSQEFWGAPLLVEQECKEVFSQLGQSEHLHMARQAHNSPRNIQTYSMHIVPIENSVQSGDCNVVL